MGPSLSTKFAQEVCPAQEPRFWGRVGSSPSAVARAVADLIALCAREREQPNIKQITQRRVAFVRSDERYLIRQGG
jgi:hypothetical protein